MYLYECYPFDNFYSCSVTISKWVEEAFEYEEFTSIKDERRKEYEKAKSVFMINYNIKEFKNCAYVAYDYINDDHYFIFQLDNNGTICIISKHSMNMPIKI